MKVPCHFLFSQFYADSPLPFTILIPRIFVIYCFFLRCAEKKNIA